jgi:hypothetical protein
MHGKTVKKIETEYSCFNYITYTSPNLPTLICSSTIDAMQTGWWSGRHINHLNIFMVCYQIVGKRGKCAADVLLSATLQRCSNHHSFFRSLIIIVMTDLNKKGNLKINLSLSLQQCAISSYLHDFYHSSVRSCIKFIFHSRIQTNTHRTFISASKLILSLSLSHNRFCRYGGILMKERVDCSWKKYIILSHGDIQWKIGI